MEAVITKYRPKKYGEVWGESHIKKLIRSWVLRGVYPQSIILVGKPGTGKTTIARLIRGSFQCLTKRQNPDPCGVCVECLYNNGAYEDIDLTNTSVENIRNREFKHLLNMHLNQIVFYFDETQRWNLKNQEILLKKVEDSDKTTFIFSTTDLNAIEQGLRSRSIVLYVTRPTVEECIQGLKPILEENAIQITDGGIRKMVKLCREVPRDCLKMLDLLVCESGEITEDFFEQEFIRKSVGAVE